MREVRDAVIDAIESGEMSEEQIYLVRYAVFHEDMHTEAFTYTRQTLGYRPPQFSESVNQIHEDCVDSSPYGDVEIPGGSFMWAPRKMKNRVDNEKWAHPVQVKHLRLRLPLSPKPSSLHLWTMMVTAEATLESGRMGLAKIGEGATTRLLVL